MSQCADILRYMEETGGITQAEAIAEFGCYRLSARISDLKKRGIPIAAKPITKLNRYGKPVSFARYSIIKGVEACQAE